MNSHTLTPAQRTELIGELCECYPTEPGANAHPDYPELGDYLASMSDAQLIRTANLLDVSVECAG